MVMSPNNCYCLLTIVKPKDITCCFHLSAFKGNVPIKDQKEEL